MFRVRVLAGALVRAADYIAAQRRRTDLIAATAQAFEKFDVLITAPTAGTPPLLTEQRPDDGFSRPLLTTVANVAAVPSMVVCGGFTAGRAAAGAGDHRAGLGRRDGAARRAPFRAGGGDAGAAAGPMMVMWADTARWR